MRHLEYEKRLVQQRIEAHRDRMRTHLAEMRRGVGGTGALGSLARLAGGRMRLAAPLAALLVRGPRWGTWLRVGVVAMLLWPVVKAALQSGGGDAVAEEPAPPAESAGE